MLSVVKIVFYEGTRKPACLLFVVVAWQRPSLAFL